MNQPQNFSSQNQQRPKRSPAEWVTFSIASFILIAVSGLVVYKWITKQDQPAILAITRTEGIRQAQGQFYVPFTVTNTGGETAESVQVVAELRLKGKVEETGEQQIDFLSSGETEEGAFVFSLNPGSGELTLRVASYKRP